MRNANLPRVLENGSLRVLDLQRRVLCIFAPSQPHMTLRELFNQSDSRLINLELSTFTISLSFSVKLLITAGKLIFRSSLRLTNFDLSKVNAQSPVNLSLTRTMK